MPLCNYFDLHFTNIKREKGQMHIDYYHSAWKSFFSLLPLVEIIEPEGECCYFCIV